MNGGGRSSHQPASAKISTGMSVTMKTKVCTACRHTRSVRQFVGAETRCKTCVLRNK